MKKFGYFWLALVIVGLLVAATQIQVQNKQKRIAEFNEWDRWQAVEAESSGYTIIFTYNKCDSGTWSEPFFAYDRTLLTFTVEDTATGEDSIKLKFEYWASENDTTYFKVCDLWWWADTVGCVVDSLDSADVYFSTSIDSHQVAPGVLYGKLKWSAGTGHKKTDSDVQGNIALRGREKNAY
jgi:hypothetical protein